MSGEGVWFFGDDHETFLNHLHIVSLEIIGSDVTGWVIRATTVLGTEHVLWKDDSRDRIIERMYAVLSGVQDVLGIERSIHPLMEVQFDGDLQEAQDQGEGVGGGSDPATGSGPGEADGGRGRDRRDADAEGSQGSERIPQGSGEPDSGAATARPQAREPRKVQAAQVEAFIDYLGVICPGCFRRVEVLKETPPDMCPACGATWIGVNLDVDEFTKGGQ